MNNMVNQKKGKTIYHGTDEPNLILSQVKSGKGYHPGAGPVEFLGPSFNTSKEVASSYGKYVFENNFVPKNPKRFSSLKSLRNDIIKTFGLPKNGQSISEYYRDIADSYRVKLQSEGYDAVVFPEGLKGDVKEKVADTIIPISWQTNLPRKKEAG